MHQILSALDADVRSFQQAERNPRATGHALARYRAAHGLTPSELAAYLQMSPSDLLPLALTPRPQPGPRFEEEVRQLARQQHYSASALRAVLLEAEALPPAAPRPAVDGAIPDGVEAIQIVGQEDGRAAIARFPERIAFQPEVLESLSKSRWPGLFRQEGTRVIFTPANGRGVYQMTGERHPRGWVAERISAHLDWPPLYRIPTPSEFDG
jgi:hypothetical protein